MSAARILYDLAPFAYRGLVVPCIKTPYDGGHSRPKLEYPFVDGVGHEHTGRAPYNFTTEHPFNNTIKPHNWYPTVWGQYREMLESKDAGDMDHPDLGTVRVVPLNWSVEQGADNLAGISVTVHWEEHVEDLESRVVYLGPDVSLPALAEEADKMMSDLGIVWPMTDSDSILEALGKLEGLVFGLQLTAQGLINQITNTLAEVIRTTEKLHDHMAWALNANLVALWNGMQQLKLAHRLTERATAFYTVPSSTTLDAVAREVGNSVRDLMGLNLSLLNQPSIPKGARVAYFTGGLSIKSPLRLPGP